MKFWYKYDGSKITGQRVDVRADWTDDETGQVISHQAELAAQGEGIFSDVRIDGDLAWPFNGGQKYQYVSGAASDANIVQTSPSLPAIRATLHALNQVNAVEYFRANIDRYILIDSILGEAAQADVNALKVYWANLKARVEATKTTMAAASTIEAIIAASSALVLSFDPLAEP